MAISSTLARRIVPWLLFASCTAPLCRGGVRHGDAVEAFTFTDIRYSPRSLGDFGDRKAYVFYFTCSGCPLAQRYLPKVQELAAAYTPRSVQFVAVNCASDESVMDIAREALETRAGFPFVKDFSGASARALGATRTPEVVVLDAEQRLRYRGRVDDQFRLGGGKPAAGRADLQEALEDVLAGREVRVKETPVDGCAITFPGPVASTRYTYAKDVAPILNKHCVECHRPGTAAPFVLTSYEKAAAKASSIAEVVETGQMPPWYAHPAYGKFSNHRGLKAEEKSVIIEWARGGKPSGDLTQAPAPPVFSESRWANGEPDLLITALTEERIPATGYIPYRYVLLPHIFLHDTWVQGIEIMPENPRVVHHANLAYTTIRGGFDEANNFLTGRVPGGIPVNLDGGTAMMIPAGAVLIFQIHYVTTGKEETDRISVGLRYAREPVRKRVRYKIIDNGGFRIPPGDAAHRVSATRQLECDATGIGLFTHMHLRGKDSTFIAHYPDGKSETLLMMPNYSFDWQLGYVWEKGAQRFPRGTKVECLSHFDNSAFNPFNPDATVEVKYGAQTYDEMMQGFFFYTDDAESLNVLVDPKTGREIKQTPRGQA